MSETLEPLNQTKSDLRETALSRQPLDCQRDLFSLPPEVHYLNCAFQAPLLRSAEEAAVEAMRRLRSPNALTSDDYFVEAERARSLFARLIGGDVEGVALVPSVSYGIALAAKNMRVRRGDNLVIAEGQFPSNVYAWRRLCAERGATLRVVPGLRVAEAIDARTAVVAVGTIDWTDGAIYANAYLGARAREVRAALVVDGTQSVGALPFHFGDVQPDFLVCSSYKWLLGPMGLGVCYVSERYRNGVPLEEAWLGRRGSSDFARLTEYCDEYEAGARRFDAGGRAQFVLLPMLNAALSQLVEWEPARVQRYCCGLGEGLRGELREFGFGVSEGAAHLFAVRPPPGVSAAALCEELQRAGVYVSLRGEAMRVSLNVFNTRDDVDALLQTARCAPRMRSGYNRDANRVRIG